MNYSEDQKRIFEFISKDTRNGKVQAVAGSGKTFTIVNSIKLFDPMDKILFLAFNKHIATELEAKVTCEVRTVNGLGYHLFRKYNKGFYKIDAAKVRNIIAFDIFDGDFKKSGKYLKVVPQIISLLKANMLEPDNFHGIAEHHGIDLPDKVEEVLQKAWDLQSQYTQSKKIDFDDQVYLPVINGWGNKEYDLVFVDEAQDLNPVMLDLIDMVAKRVIFVGDDKQAIYGFRGADSKAMDTIASKFETVELPLHTCYRCPKNVVKEAQKIVPYIKSFDEQIDGEVVTIQVKDFDPQDSDLVICRTNAPLVKSCFEIIRKGKKATVKGRDIGQNLIDLIGQIPKGKDIGDFLENLDTYLNTQIKKLRNNENAIVAVEDKVETIRVVADKCNTVSEIESFINKIFSDGNTTGVLHCSIHRAKGLENGNVFILRPDLMPHPKCEQEWAQTQEMNLKYVAITRAQRKLIYVEGK